MLNTTMRALWWLVTYERPARREDYAALLALFGLALLGALVLTWPWLVELIPRALATGWAAVQAGVMTLAGWVRNTLPHLG